MPNCKPHSNKLPSESFEVDYVKPTSPDSPGGPSQTLVLSQLRPPLRPRPELAYRSRDRRPIRRRVARPAERLFDAVPGGWTLARRTVSLKCGPVALKLNISPHQNVGEAHFPLTIASQMLNAQTHKKKKTKRRGHSLTPLDSSVLSSYRIHSAVAMRGHIARFTGSPHRIFMSPIREFIVRLLSSGRSEGLGAAPTTSMMRRACCR